MSPGIHNMVQLKSLTLFVGPFDTIEVYSVIKIKEWFQSSGPLMLRSCASCTNGTSELKSSLHHFRSLTIELQCTSKSLIGWVTQILMNGQQLVLFPLGQSLEIAALFLPANLIWKRFHCGVRDRVRGVT